MAVKIASYYDIPVLLQLVEEFIKESGWGWTYDKGKSIAMLESYIDSDECAVLLIESDIPAGFAMVAYGDEFHVERLGYLSKFYVSPHARQSGAGRMLAEACSQWFDCHECKVSFLTSTANINQDKLFENLFKKKGFSVCGNVMSREQN